MIPQNIVTSHKREKLKIIDDELSSLGVQDYRYCIENDCYICDKSGNFYSVCVRQLSNIGTVIEKYRIKKLKGSTDKNGYVTYRIAVNGIKKHLKAHRMMMNAWDSENPHLVVNHIDGNKKNNSLKNLEWCTIAENNAHAIRTGLYNPHMKKHFNYSVNPTEWMSIYILHKHCGYSLSRLGKMNRCTHDTIKAIIKRIEGIMPQEVLYGK